jgi:hypothetical protein
MLEDTKKPSQRSVLFSFFGILGTFLLFLLIVFVAYIPYRPRPVDAQLIQDRKAKLSDYRMKVDKEINSYGWVNQPKGVVRIPVSEAMKITVSKYETAQ